MDASFAASSAYIALTADEIIPLLSDPDALSRICNRQRLALFSSPAQSNFRVFAYLVITSDDKLGYSVVEGANMEQGWIGGAICAERAALSRLRFFSNPRIVKVVVTTDSDQPISPGMLCREYLMSSAAPETDVVIGNCDSSIVTTVPLGSLFPYPYVYRKHSRTNVEAFASGAASALDTSKWSPRQLQAYEAARLSVVGDSLTGLHPVRLGAAVLFENGDIECAWVLKGLEYGCTMCPVSQLLREMEKRRLPRYCQPCTVESPLEAIERGVIAPLSSSAHAGQVRPECLVMVDQWGVAHAPFASARAILTEYGYGDVDILVHDSGTKAAVCKAIDLCPPPANGAFLTHDAFV
jgi:cytidine deaminase